MNSFCTIITSDYLPFAKALYKSLQSYDKEVRLQVLIVDNINEKHPGENGITFHNITDILSSITATRIYQKYSVLNTNSLRWALKPAFMAYLLEKDFYKIMYTDPDIYFCNDFNFLWEELDRHSIILTPHWTDTTPLRNEENFLMSFRIGLYNAGFIGANKKGVNALKWWAEVCTYAVNKDERKGLFDDQKWLDMIPVLCADAGIIRHKGCNVGSWNIHSNERIIRNNQLLINGEFPVVFIHFNNETVKHVLNGNDKMLRPSFDEYKKLFELDGIKLETFLSQLEKLSSFQFFRDIKQKTRFRTRIKNFLFSLSQKL